MKLGDMQQTPRHLINGRWEIGTTTGVSVNPSDIREVVAEYARADRNQAGQAVRAAADALRHWSRSAPQRRADVLDFVGSELLARKDELGTLLAREEGKPLPEAVAEVVRSGHLFKFFAGEALRIPGELTSSLHQGVQVDTTREPVGVVAVLSAWNFPIATPAWKIAPALAFGNTVVFKPAERVPACGWALAEIIARSGLPAGAFNLVMGSGREVGQTLVDHPLVDAVSFTGSGPVGARILRSTAARGARVQLDMGGKNPLVVLADADLDHAADCALQGAYGSAGQHCMASSRIVVEASVHDDFTERLHRRLAALPVGHALERGTGMGPVVDERQLAQNIEHIAAARQDGAEHVFGGGRVERPTPGHYLSPALFIARPEHRIAREETFGPVACLLRADDYEHALALANDTPRGLCAGICTTSLKHAMHFKRHARAGMTMVNLPTAGANFLGERREPGHSPRERGRHTAEFFTTVRTGYMLA